MHLWSSSKLLNVYSVLYGFRIKGCLAHNNTGKLAIGGRGNGHSGVAAIAGFKHTHADFIDDIEALHVFVVQELHCLLLLLEEQWSYLCVQSYTRASSGEYEHG